MSATVAGALRRVEISHPEKVLFGESGFTKLDLARHYEAVGDVMLPHLRGRPLALEVYPQGIEKRGFFMKSVPDYFPPWIETVEVPKRGGYLTQVVVDRVETLIYLAGQNVITPHIWLARADMPRQPDRLIIDLDPADGVRFAEVRAAAREAGALLRARG